MRDFFSFAIARFIINAGSPLTYSLVHLFHLASINLLHLTRVKLFHISLAYFTDSTDKSDPNLGMVKQGR